MNYELAPIVIFTYKRLDTLQKAIESLKSNELATQSLLYIYSDAARSDNDVTGVTEVRNYLKTINGFKNIEIIQAVNNIGLANSIINGVSDIINRYGKIIVLEDDLILTPNFLTFMNEALNYYQNNSKVYSISGFMFDIKSDNNWPYDIFFTKRHCSWGWAMWKDRWNEIDWAVPDFFSFLASKKKQKEFDEIGSDLSSSLIKQMNGQINSWAIRCNYHQFLKQTYTVYPLKSKVINLGFGENATHTTQRFNKYKAVLDDELKYSFNFVPEAIVNNDLLRRFKHKYSISTRLIFYLLNKLIDKW